MKAVIFTLILTLELFGANALAQGIDSKVPFRKWRQNISQALLDCPTLRCEDGQIQLETLAATEVAELPYEVRQSLRASAFDLAQVWGDTILEGGYEASNDIIIENVELVLINDEVTGYRITYLADAIETATQNKGVIRESGFVDIHTFKAFRDPNALAKFFPN